MRNKTKKTIHNEFKVLRGFGEHFSRFFISVMFDVGRIYVAFQPLEITREKNKKTFQSPLMLYMHPFTYTRRPSQMSLFANANEEFLISAFKLLINAE